MRKITKKIAYWLVPPGFQNILSECREIGVTNWALQNNIIKNLTKENIKFKDIHLGERCFILATGPSINKQNLKPLKNEKCIAVGAFFLHKDIKEINPNYHVCAPTHTPFKMELSKKYFEGYRNNYSEKTNIFLGHTPYKYSYMNFLQQNPEYKSNNIHFLDYSGSPELTEKNVKKPDLWDITKKPFGCRTVIYCAIQIAVYMGFSKIYLLGCDHDYLNDIFRVTNHHFYKEAEGVSDVEHLSSFTTEKWLEEYYFRWKQYRIMNEFLQLKGIQIFNATEGGMLDVFSRVKLQEIICEE